MATTIAENANNDLFVGDDGNISFATDVQGDPEATSQICKSRIEAQRGEMQYAVNQGMPTRATAWDRFNPQQFEAAARSIMLATPGVTSVPSFALSRTGNELDYDADIQTIYGSSTVSASQ